MLIMTISNIIYFAKEYAILGGVVAFFSFLLFLTGYYIIYKKVLKKPGELSKFKLFISIIFVIYIVFVLSATVLNRRGGYENLGSYLLPFSSYKQAWNRFTIVEWRNFILNIMLFVPMGFLLPLLSSKLQTFWKTYVIGFGTAVLIESIQYVLKSGVVEFDDVFNNTLGTIIGYGILMFLLYFIGNRKGNEKKKLSKIVCLQLPFIFSVMAFTIIFTCYHNQELGNLAENYSYRVSLKDVTIALNTELDNTISNVYVYQAQTGNQEDTLKIANDILKNFGTSVNADHPDVYQDTVVYYSIDGDYSLWVDYKGLTTWFTDYNQSEAEKAAGYDEKKVREILSQCEINLPDIIEFNDEGDGNYSIKVSMQPTDGGILDGELTCTITTSGKVKNFRNHIIFYKQYIEREIISEEEAYQRMKDGKFNYELQDKIKTLEIEDVTLGYRMDSKGFYQPAYEFQAKLNGNESLIVIPALK